MYPKDSNSGNLNTVRAQIPNIQNPYPFEICMFWKYVQCILMICFQIVPNYWKWNCIRCWPSCRKTWVFKCNSNFEPVNFQMTFTIWIPNTFGIWAPLYLKHLKTELLNLYLNGENCPNSIFGQDFGHFWSYYFDVKKNRLLWASYSSWHQNTAGLKYGRAYLHGCTIVQRHMGSW